MSKLPLFLVLAVMSGSAIGAFLDELNILNIENRTGSSIRHLSVTPGDSRHRGANVLRASGPLPAGTTSAYFIHYPDTCGPFDILAVTESGRRYFLKSFQVCDGKAALAQISTKHEAGAALSEDLVTVTFENSTGQPLTSLFFTPGDSNTWGVDYVGATETVGLGGELSLQLPRPATSLEFAVRAVDRRQRTYSFSVEIPASKSRIVFEVLAEDIDDVRDR